MESSEQQRKDQIRKTEGEVLRVVTESDPSTRSIGASPESFAAHEARLTTLYRDHLKFPLQMFRNARLLDFGSGSGENTVFYARWGASCTLVDMNADACAAAARTFDRYAPLRDEHTIVNSSLFEAAIGDDFDIVVSTGVLHHNAYHADGFVRLVSHLKPGGFALIAVGNKAGFFQRNLQRLVLFRLASNEDEIIALARRLFSENLARAVKFGGRTEKAVIYDTYVNPKLDAVSTRQVLHWFKDAGVQLYSGWPNVFPPQLADSATTPLLDLREWPEAATYLEMLGMAHDRDDRDDLEPYFAQSRALDECLDPVLEAVNNLSLESHVDLERVGEQLATLRRGVGSNAPFVHEQQKIARLLEEVAELLSLVGGGDVGRLEAFVKSTKHLFRGTNGIGITYYAGYKLPK